MIKVNKNILVMMFLAMACFAHAQEQPGAAFSLQQAIDYAVKNSPSFQNAMLDEQAALYRKREITGLGLPQINGNVDVKDYLFIPTSLVPGDFFGQPGTFIPVQFGVKYNATVGAEVSQLVFSSDYIFGLRASEQYMSLSKISSNRTKAEVVAQVSKAYYNVLINRDRLKLLDANIAQLKKLVEDVRAINKAGFAEGIEMERLEVQFNNLTTERQKTARLIGLSETMLKFQMGYKLAEGISLSDSLSFNQTDFQELAPATDIRQRPDYQLLKATQNLLELDVKRLRWGYLPTIAAYGAFQYNAQRNEFNLLSFDKNDPMKQWFKIGLIGATMRLNIFDGLQRHNKIQQARIEASKNLNTLRNVELAGELESTVASITYNNAYATLLMQRKNMDLAQKVYETSQKKYTSGVGSNLEIVSAETALVEAQTNYYNAVFDMLVARIDYQKATGTLVK